MSIKWISYIWDKTDYRQGERLVALSLADFANDEGECFPYLDTIARKANVSVRQVQRILRNFEGDGFIEMVNKPGRGIKPQFKLKKVTSATPFQDRKKVTFETLKGDIRDTKKVTSATSYIKDEPSLEPSLTLEPKPKRESFRIPQTFIPINPSSEEKLLSWLDAVAVAVGAGSRRGLVDSRWDKACIKAIESGLNLEDFAGTVKREYATNSRYTNPEKCVQIAQSERQQKSVPIFDIDFSPIQTQ